MADRRRVNGPENSFPPLFEDDLSPEPSRNPSDIRPICLVSQANGSAYIETKKTKIACAIYGPRQSKSTTYSEQGRLNVEVKFAPFSCHRRRAPLRDSEDRSVAMAIHQALVSSVRLELFPKSTIDVLVMVIEADGLEGCIASGTTAASCALADAGVEMVGLVVSCSACLKDDQIWLDPTALELDDSVATVVFSSVPALGTVSSVMQLGEISPPKLFECMDACREKCLNIHAVLAQAILDHVAP